LTFLAASSKIHYFSSLNATVSPCYGERTKKIGFS
jgi:hypothetical protein